MHKICETGQSQILRDKIRTDVSFMQEEQGVGPYHLHAIDILYDGKRGFVPTREYGYFILTQHRFREEARVLTYPTYIRIVVTKYYQDFRLHMYPRRFLVRTFWGVLNRTT